MGKTVHLMHGIKRCACHLFKPTNVFLLILLSLNFYSNQSMSQALRATGGTGIHRDKIYWLDFSGMADLAAGGTVTRTVTVNGLTVTVIIDNVAFAAGAPGTARVQAYRSGTWTGDGLDDVYNRGGTGTANTLVNGLITNTPGNEATFRLRAHATLNGLPYDVSLIYANPEEDNLTFEESRATTNGSGWQLLEGVVQSASATRQIVFSASPNQTINVKMSSNNTTTAANVALMHTSLAATTSASPLTVNFGMGPQLGTTGNGAVALGIMINQDMGDAPVTYGTANNFVAATITGGSNNPPPLGGTYTLSGTLSNITAGTVTAPTSPRLGANAADIENDYPASPVGNNDDNTGTDDEDAFTTNPSVNIAAPTHTANMTAFKNTSTAGTPVYVMAWIDANRDGIFGPLEYATTSFTANNSTQNISLAWNLAAMPKSAGSSYMRIRITTTNPATLTDNAGTPADERSFDALANGETEDYPLTLVQPVPCTAGIVYGIQSTSSNADSQRVMYRVDPTNGALSNPINLFGAGAAFTSSTQRTTSLALDVSTNTVWFNDRTNPKIYSYDLNTGTHGTVSANFGNPALTGNQNINKAAYNIRDGYIYFHNATDNIIYRFDPANPTTAAVALGPIVVSGYTEFGGGDLVFDSLGNMLAVLSTSNIMAVFPATYNATGVYQGFSLTGQLIRTVAATTPAGLAFLANGNMLVGNGTGQTTTALQLLNTTTGTQTNIATGPPSGPFGFVDLASCVSPMPQLVVRKAATYTCNAGTTNVTYTVTVQNTGTFHAFNVRLIDALPAGLTLASATLNGAALTTTNIGTTGVLINSPSATAGSGQLFKGETATIVLNCTAASSTPATYSNQAFVTFTGVETLGLANNRIPSDDPSTGAANDATVINNAGCASITGSLLNDNDGITGGVNGTTLGMGSVTVGLYASNGTTLITSTTTNASGVYTLSNITAGATYILKVTAPSGYFHVSSHDGITPTDGETTVVLNANQTAINFGLNQPPTATTTPPTSPVNPGGTANYTVPAASFGGTDPNNGSIASLRITTFPSNAASITINGVSYTSATFPGVGVSVPTNSAGNPSQTITVDPAAGAVTVGIAFTVTDAAGLTSTGSTLNLAFTAGATVSGIVYNDNNGITGNANGNAYTGGGLNVVLLSGTTVAAVSAVSTVDGTYSLADAANGSYTVMLTTANPGIGTTLTAPSVLPGIFANVSSHDNITPTDGRTSVTIATNTSVTGIHFGINEPATATAVNPASQPNPGGTNNVTIPPTSFTGTDPNGGTITNVTITAFPSNATSITINSINYTSATFPVGGVTVPANGSGNPTQAIAVDPGPGAVTVVIPFTIRDGAGLNSAVQNLSVAFTAGATVSGIVYNDNNGITGNANGNAYTGGSLNVVLLSGTTVVAVSAVSTVDGTYSLADAGNGSYTVMLTTANPGIGTTLTAPSVLPGTFVNVSSHDNITPTDGRTSVTISGNSALTGIHFGINEPATVTVNNPASQPNPGGTNNVTIPATSFAGSDPNGGSITNVTITTFPTNATSITINGNIYTAGTFPGGGVSIPTNASGNPTQTIAVDPASGAVTVGITFTFTDMGGLVNAPSTLNVAFTAAGSVSGTIFNDTDGTNNNANGTNYTGGGLNVILISGGNVVSVSPVSTVDGSYSLADAGNGTYTVMLTTANPPIGSAAPSSSTLPGTFRNVSSNDNVTPTDGITTVTISGGAPLTGIHFGIAEPPVPTSTNLTSQNNPGGTSNVVIPATNFSASHPNGGTIASLTITAFPSNVTSITINGIMYTSATFPAQGVTVPTNGAGNPTQSIEIDPVDGLVTVQIPYTFQDGTGLSNAASTFDIVFNSTLPITLETFDAAVSGCNAMVSWTVSNAINFSHFEIETSTDGITYRSVASVPYTAGTTSYHHTQLSLASGRYLYRLRLVDLDGTYEYSKTASVTINCSQQPIIAYPNPVHDMLTVKGLHTGDIVLLHDNLGKLLISRKANDTRMELSMIPYSNGSYFITVVKKTGELLVKKNIIKSAGR